MTKKEVPGSPCLITLKIGWETGRSEQNTCCKFIEMMFQFLVHFQLQCPRQWFQPKKNDQKIQRFSPRQMVCRAKDLCHPWHTSLYQTSVSRKIKVEVSRLGSSSQDSQHNLWYRKKDELPMSSCLWFVLEYFWRNLLVHCARLFISKVQWNQETIPPPAWFVLLRGAERYAPRTKTWKHNSQWQPKGQLPI